MRILKNKFSSVEICLLVRQIWFDNCMGLKKTRMKKSFFVLLIALFIFQTSHSQSLEEKFSSDDNIDMVLVTRDMFELISEIDSDKKSDLKNFYSRLEYLATFSSDNPASADKIYREGLAYVRQKGMRLLTKIKDADKIAEFYYIPASEKGHARELILLIRYPNGRASLLHVIGNINMRKLSLLALQATMLEAGLLKQAEQAAP